MSSCRINCIKGTLAPFLYPTFSEHSFIALRRQPTSSRAFFCKRWNSTTAPHQQTASQLPADGDTLSHLDPSPDSYSLTPFADRCIISLEAGSGGHGCVSFVREKYIEEGPPNGGDGGSGGNIYIQAVEGETSLHKLARRRFMKAGRGKNGQGKMKGGERGSDVLITVPVGTVVREVSRYDPVEQAEAAQQRGEGYGGKGSSEETKGNWRRDRWLVFPGLQPSQLSRMEFPSLPKPTRSHLSAIQPEAPIWLDLDKHMETPMLIAAGAMGGLGNPHFVTQNNVRPKMATKGDEGMKLSLQLELKILADLGLVGLPNAGKSTLLRALSNSRARIGNWAFTTLQPNVGTVVLDNHTGRPVVEKRGRNGERKVNFTIADVPGLIEDAHLDKGLGLGFLRHVERAAVLAFVVDLSAGDAVQALKLLWKEVSEYEAMKGQELNAETERRMVSYKPPGSASSSLDVEESPGEAFHTGSDRYLPELTTTPISAKPWFVVGTKADLAETQANYQGLHKYLQDINSGSEPHPSGRKNAWKKQVHSVPISAIRAEGVEVIPKLVMELLDD